MRFLSRRLPGGERAAHAGWSDEAVTKMVQAYTHAGYQGRLYELDAASQGRLSPSLGHRFVVGRPAHVSERATVT